MLSNVSKSTFMKFHMPQKHIIILTSNIYNNNIDWFAEFSFLGLTINRHLKWDSHINKIALKISSATGVIYKLKIIYPQKIFLTLYNTIILPHWHIHYGILYWGHNLNRISVLQKNIWAITLSNYLSQTEPIFKRLSTIKIEDISLLNQMKFCFKLLNNNLPNVYFEFINVTRDHEIHSHNTRNRGEV